MAKSGSSAVLVLGALAAGGVLAARGLAGKTLGGAKAGEVWTANMHLTTVEPIDAQKMRDEFAPGMVQVVTLSGKADILSAQFKLLGPNDVAVTLVLRYRRDVPDLARNATMENAAGRAVLSLTPGEHPDTSPGAVPLPIPEAA